MGSEDKHGEESVSIGLKLMLIAAFSLFGMILFIIFLHFCAIHLIRRRQRRRRIDYLLHYINTQIGPVDVSSVLEAPYHGLDPLILASLPKLLYKQTEQFNQGEEATECSVCLGTIVGDETIRVLPNCKHIFHVDCVDKWFNSNTTCPICRAVAEPKVQSGHGNLGMRVQAQPTAPPVEGGDEPHDCDDLEKVGCSGLRIGSLDRMVSSKERSLRRTQSTNESAIDDIEKH